MNYAYYKDGFRLIAADLSKQKALDADPNAIQQIIFTGQADKEASVFLRPWKTEKNSTWICKRNDKSVLTTYKWLNTVKGMQN